MEKTNSNPLVSIVLTTLNCARFLREAVDSCINQTYRNLELIIVDGGSTDGTLEILTSYQDPRIRTINQKYNFGKLPGALNLGLDNALGEYLSWMQGDSIYHPKAIYKMVDCLQIHPDVGQVYTDFWQTNELGEIEKTIQTREPEEFLKVLGDPAGVCFMIRRSVRNVVGPHDVDAYPSHDYDYRMRIAMQFNSLHIHEPLYYWRLHHKSLSGTIPWTFSARTDLRIRQKLGISTPHQAQHDLATIDIADAFENYQQHHHRVVPALVLTGIKRDFRFLTNRGVWSIFLRSIVSSIIPMIYRDHHA